MGQARFLTIGAMPDNGRLAAGPTPARDTGTHPCITLMLRISPQTRVDVEQNSLKSFFGFKKSGKDSSNKKDSIRMYSMLTQVCGPPIKE